MIALASSPESPAWLLWTGRAEDAKVATQQLTGQPPEGGSEAAALLPSAESQTAADSVRPAILLLAVLYVACM